jgi:hypothetical protein
MSVRVKLLHKHVCVKMWPAQTCLCSNTVAQTCLPVSSLCFRTPPISARCTIGCRLRLASVCRDDFVLVRLPDRRLFESLLWQLYGSGLCCAVFGPVVADMDGRITRFEMLGLFISTPTDHDSEASRKPILYSGPCHSFSLGELACEMLPQ